MPTTSVALYCVEHLTRFGEGVCQRFFAEDMLAVLGGCNADRGVGVAGGRDIDQTDIVARYQFLPVGFVSFPAKLCGCGAHRGLVAPADRFHHRA
jgi:hypothetical protein